MAQLLLNVILGTGNRMSSFVFVPSCKDHTRVRKNVMETKWLMNMLLALGGPGNELTAY
jgi:hypothetical protein